MKEQSQRFMYLLVGLACLFIIIWGIQNSAFILNPILLALVITITVLPLPQKFAERGMPGWLSLVLTIGIVVGALGIVGLLVVFSVGKVATAVPTYANNMASQQMAASIATASSTLTDTATSPLSAFTANINSSQVNALLSPSQFNQVMTFTIQIIGQGLVTLFLTMMIFGFMLVAAVSMPGAARMGLGAENPVIARLTKFTQEVRHYVSITTTVNFLVGLGDAFLLWMMGIPFAWLWGILAWVMGYIPSVGFWVALIPPALIAWAQFGFQQALVVILMYILINGSVQNILQPKLMGEGLKITPVVIYLSLIIWGWLLGGMGALLAVPLTLLIFAVLDSFENTRWVVVLLSVIPQEKEEKEKAQNQLKGLWEKANLFNRKHDDEKTETGL
jgi:AI-2 transport protein TqsA